MCFSSMIATNRVPSRGAVRYTRVSVVPVREYATFMLHRINGVSYVLGSVPNNIMFVVETDAPGNYNS